MIVNAEHYWPLVETNEIREKNAFNIVFETTQKMNELETNNILDSASSTFRIEFKAMRLSTPSTHRAKHCD